MTKEQFIELVNATRKQNKGSWYQLYQVSVAGELVSIKGYNTWIQRIEVVNKFVDSSPSDMSVKELNEWLNEVLTW